jgi:DNA-binding transcriptional ArsR family regulator
MVLWNFVVDYHQMPYYHELILSFQKEINNFAIYILHNLTGETQLRARRTRIKILRAIADLEGSASFSEIRKSTGLSTGSIYYHLERMSNYIVKDSKHYFITEKGLQLLHEIDPKSTSSSFFSRRYTDISDDNDGQRLKVPRIGSHIFVHRADDEHRHNLSKFWGDYAFVSIITAVCVFICIALTLGTHLFFPALSSAGKMISNASLISSLSIAALLSLSFLIMLKRNMIPTGYRGIMLSVLTVLSVLVVNILIFSGLGSQIGISPSTF